MTPRLLKTLAGSLCAAAVVTAQAQNVMINDVPDYSWYSGCFGTASGNMMGFWDRNGLSDFYTGPTAGGVAPLSTGGAANKGIRSMWASKAGFDGRPASQPGHIDDYWQFFENENVYSYESTAPDPYQVAGRPEHSPDCLGDLIGASQNKWSDLDGECSGNIDAFSFVFWDHTGERRVNFTPPAQNGVEMRDVQSGLRRWAEYRGYRAQVTSQLVDFNPEVQLGKGFHFADLKAEIDAGYPVMLILQNPNERSRSLHGIFPNDPLMPRGNPEIHAMVAYSYAMYEGQPVVIYRTSWGDGDSAGSFWGPDIWRANMTLRGVITFHPVPKITQMSPESDGVKIKWDGPSATLSDVEAGTVYPVHWYAVEKAEDVTGPFSAIGEATTDREMILPRGSSAHAFYRVRVMTPEEAGKPRG